MGEIDASAWVSAADVTPEALTDVLRAGAAMPSGARVVNVEAEPLGVGVGILALLWRLHVTYEPAAAGPATLVLKLPHTSPETLATVSAFRFYEREFRFYRDFAERSPLATPACHASWFDPDTGRFALLLEDLGSCVVYDQLAGCPAGAARDAVVALARHHAVWWDAPALAEVGWLARPCDPPNPQGIVARLAASWPMIESQFADLLPGSLFDVAKRMPEIAMPLLEAASEQPLTLLHGDYRLDNLFFPSGVSAGERDVVVADWQICMMGRGPADLGLFLSQSLDPATRKKSEHGLLRAYHETLVANGVTRYRFDECWDDYRRATLLCLVYPLSAGAVDLVNDRAVEYFMTTLVRATRAVIDLDVLELAPA